MLKLGVLVSGGGTNLQAIMDAIDSGVITNAEVGLVISNNPGAYALKRAESRESRLSAFLRRNLKIEKNFISASGRNYRKIGGTGGVLAGLSGGNSTYDRGSISEQNHQYSSIPHSVFLWRRTFMVFMSMRRCLNDGVTVSGGNGSFCGYRYRYRTDYPAKSGGKSSRETLRRCFKSCNGGSRMENLPKSN